MTALPRMTAAFALSASLFAVHISSAYAQAEGGGGGFLQGFPSAQAFVGRAAMAPNCPAIQFHVVPLAKNQLHGIAFEENAAGTAPLVVYDVHGTIVENSKITMDLKPLTGGSPLKVTGTFENGMLMASMNGGNVCHSGSFMLMGVAQPSTHLGPHQ